MKVQKIVSAAVLGCALSLNSTHSLGTNNNKLAMCEKGMNLFKVTVRAFEGVACSVSPIAYWAEKNCSFTENYKDSHCHKNAKKVVEGLTSDLKQYYEGLGLERMSAIQTPEDMATIVAKVKADGKLTSEDLDAWKKFKSHFPIGQAPVGNKLESSLKEDNPFKDPGNPEDSEGLNESIE